MSPLPTKVQAGYYYDSDGDGAEEYYPDPWETDPGYSDSGYTDAAGGDNTSPGYFDYGDGPFGSGEQPVPPVGAGSGGWPNGGPDSDGDGLEDDFELTVSGSYLIASDLFYDPTTLVWENYEYWETRVLDPNNVDSDSDGIPDGVEYLTLAPLAEALGGFVSFDPLDPTDGPADYDNDGLSNRLEVMAYGTDPFSWDSDQDGWFDSEEILLQTDPLNPADPGDSETPGSGDSGSGGANGGAVSPLPDSGSGEAAGESPVGGDTPESAATGTGGEAGATSGETAVSGEDPATTSVPRFLLRGGRLFYRTGEFVKSPVYWWYLDQNDNEGFDSGEPSRPSATPLPEGGYEGNPAAEGYRFLPEMSDALAQTWFQDQNGNGKFDPPMEPSVLVIDPRTRGGGGPSGEQWFRNRAGGSERWHDGGPRETVHFTDGLSAVARYPELATRGEQFIEADKEAFQARAWWGAVEAPPMPADFVGSLQEWNPDAPQVFDIDAMATEIRWASQSPVVEDMEKTCLIEHGPLTAQAEPNHQQANVQAVTFFIKKGETVARVAAQGGSAGAGFSLTPTSVILNPPLERGSGHFARLLPMEVISDLNNDGEITSADNALRDAALKSGASEEEKKKGTEFLFINDKMSNGVWDADDDGVMTYSYGSGYDKMPKPPASHKDDDDAEPLKVSLGGLNTGIVWFDHPTIDKLEFFETRECLPGDKLNLTLASPFDLSADTLPETIYVRLRDDWAGTDQEGNLRMFIGKSTTEIWGELQLPLTVVRDFGSKHFFHAARDYILENNARVCIRDHGYPFGPDPSIIFRLCVMREEATTMTAFDALAGGQEGIELSYFALPAVPRAPAVMINGNQCFWSAGWDEKNPFDLPNMLGNIADKCHGRVIRGGVTAGTSSDNFDITTKPAAGSPLAGPDPIPAGTLAGPDGVPGTADDIANPYADDPGGKYLGCNAGAWTFAAGRAGGSDALGGLSTNYASDERADKAHQMIGYAEGEETGKGCIFTATQIKGVGYGPIIKGDASVAGVPALSPSVDAGAIKLFILDSGAGSLALMHIDPTGTMRGAYMGRKTNFGFPYYVNNYLALDPAPPRP